MVIDEQQVGKLWFLHVCFNISFDELLAHKFFHSFHENEQEHSRLIVSRDSKSAPRSQGIMFRNKRTNIRYRRVFRKSGTFFTSLSY